MLTAPLRAPFAGAVRAVLLVLVLAAIAAAAAAQPLTAYDDQLRNGFTSWGWGVIDFGQTAVVHSGTAAISFEPDHWDGLFLHRDAGIDPATHAALELWIHGGTTGGQQLSVALLIGGSPAGTAPLAGFLPGGAIPAGTWVRVTIPFAALGVTWPFDGFWLQDDSGTDQATIYLDDLRLLPNDDPPPPPGTVAVAVSPGADLRPVNPWIFGVSFGSAAGAAALPWPLDRWGGNATTRYSWEHDIANRGDDWFFYNIEYAHPDPPSLPAGSAADRFVAAARAAGSEPLLTVPLIGWTPIDRTRRWGFSVARYGPQSATECTATGYAPWCQPDAGNGVRPDDTFVTGNDPHDTSREIGPGFVTGWLTHLASRPGGPVRLIALDNEPMLWNSTHRDVHPEPVTYDELWERTLTYATAIRAHDPQAILFGPDLWGWCAYFHSAADDCSPGADQAAHGGMEFLPWYLSQVRAHELAHGVRLVDLVAVHYYPQAEYAALSDDESPAVAARRLRSLKGLYDPAYVDESWIHEPVYLLPRLRAWIDTYLPGAGIAITEYNWGGDDGPSSALAHAEALAIFAREGVTAANRWVAPTAGSRVEDAFRLYLDYDGLGSRIAGDAVRALSADVDAVGAYAIRQGRTLFLLLFQKGTEACDAAVTVGTGLDGPGALWRFTPTARLAAAGEVPTGPDGFTLALPPRSATLVRLTLANELFRDGFESGATGAWAP